jgi:hypothetical protein
VQRLEIAGKKFGRLTVIKYVGDGRWECVCDCGNAVTPYGRAVARVKTKSCGCYRKDNTGKLNNTHGMSKTKEYQIWASMIARCHIPSATGYERWGGRGISVCARWRNSFTDFLADMGNRPTDKHSIDRINNEGIYEPANCRWATRSEQAKNVRPRKETINKNTVWFDGKTLKQWSVELNLPVSCLRYRWDKYKSVHLPDGVFSPHNRNVGALL